MDNITANLSDAENRSLTSDDKALFSISEESYNNFAFVSNVFVTPIICVSGMLGNCLGLGVLWRDTKQQKLSIYIYLLALTLFDTIYLLVGLIRSIPQYIRLHNEHMANYIEEHMKLGSIYIDMVLAHTGTGIIIIMSIERLLALVRPFTVKHTWLSKYPRGLIGVCFFVNVVFLLPFPICFEVDSYIGASNHTVYYLRFASWSKAPMDYFQLLQTFVDFFIPCVVVLATNIAIIVAYSRMLKKRVSTLSVVTGGQQAKLTVTVFCITIMFFLLSLPNLFIKVLAFIDKEYSFDGRYKLAFWLFIDISNLFTYINAANDFAIYILVSTHYRMVFCDMYCTCRWSSADEFSSATGLDGSSERRPTSSVNERF
ncbi:G-protein coupled receptor 183-A-like [Mya arenaria]|uniref:G-protein coupled receptor 183-A-like n=1 Tax=Mya arenaria TaxID=6604 RepID=UPI0022E22BC0|nr:G-protein coupled receptor 183-A-like [Mya arenaria]